MALNLPNFAEMLQRGYEAGTRNRLQREGEQRQNQLRDLASRAYAAPAQERQGLVQQAIAVDPEAGFAVGGQIEKREADQVARAGNVADYLLTAISSKNPAQIQGAYNAVKPYFQSIAPAGTAIPDTVDDSIIPMLHQLKAASSGSAGAGLTNEAKTFQQLTQGFSPEDLEKARRINAGLDPRAVTGAFKQIEVTGRDGRKRVGTVDPTTQTIRVLDESTNTFRPLGQGETYTDIQQPGVTAPAVAGAATTLNPQQDFSTLSRLFGIQPTSVDRTPERNAQVGGVANSFHLTGQASDWAVPTEQKQQFIQTAQRLGYQAIDEGDHIHIEPPGSPRPGGQAGAPQIPQQIPSKAPAGFGVSRSPEEQTRLTEQAKIDAEIANYRQMTELAAEREAATISARERAQAQAVATAALPQVVSNANEAESLIDQLIAHPGREAATGASSRLDPRNFVPGTEATNFRVLLDQVKGKAFLQAFQSLKGAGAITEQEGAKATAAIARLDTAQTEEAFVQALRDLKTVIDNGRKSAERKAGAQTGRPALPPGFSWED